MAHLVKFNLASSRSYVMINADQVVALEPSGATGEATVIRTTARASDGTSKTYTVDASPEEVFNQLYR